jgi:motility quorum-sensing regulator/GCU-specific mRNA interferase toxin
MTTHANHRVWQDVYHVHTQYGLAYVKVTLWPDSRVVIQFKGK